MNIFRKNIFPRGTMKKLEFVFSAALMLCALPGSAASQNKEQNMPEQNGTSQTETLLNKSAFKYPYDAHSAGIELYPGLRSGTSLEWFVKDVESRRSNFKIYGGSSKEKWISLTRNDLQNVILKFGTELRPDQEMVASLGKKEVKGGLISVYAIIRDNPDRIDEVIERYMKAYPGLKRSRTTQDESERVKQNGVVCNIKNIAVKDKLESDRVEIVIESRNIKITASGRRSREELQFIVNSMSAAFAPRRAIQVTITDKSLKKYLATLKQ